MRLLGGSVDSVDPVDSVDSVDSVDGSLGLDSEAGLIAPSKL